MKDLIFNVIMQAQERLTPGPKEPKDLIFPILKEREWPITPYEGIIFYLQIAIFGIIVFLLVFYFIRRYFLAGFRQMREEESFFIALARAFNFTEEEISLAQRAVMRERQPEPYLIFCSSKIFDPCFDKEINRIQKKRFLPDMIKGRDIGLIYQMRQKIF